MVHIDVDQLDHAQDAEFGAQRHADDGTRLPLSHFVNALGEARIGHHVGDDQSLAVFGDPSGDSLPYLETYIFQRLGGASDCNSEVELVLFFVHHQQ